MENKPNGLLPGGGPENPEKRSKLFSSLLTLIMVALMISLLWSALKVDGKRTDSEYYQIIAYFDEGKVTEYSLNLGTRKLTYVLEGEEEKRTYTVPSYELFVADTHETVREYNKEHPDNPIKMNYESGSSNYWITQMLPMVGMLVMMGFMLYWLVKKMGNTVMDDTRRSMAFGKARLKTGEDGRKTTFDDVAGLDEEKEDLQEIVEFLKNPAKFDDLGARIPKGVLLVGPPGTGKTLLARAVAGEADATFLSISGSDFVEMYVGVGASRVRDLFDNAKKNIPSIVFIDEIDAVGRQRGAGMGGGHDEREQTLNQLLVEMDGFGKNAGVIIMAATNRPDILDPALLRPGRFDRQVTVNYPDVAGREAILKVHARNKPIGPDVRLDEIARATSGFTGADLENLLNEAALLAARRGKRALTRQEIEEATIKVVVGTEKRSKKIGDEEKRLTAYHEAGHAVTNFYLDTLDPVHQVSIIPRGMAGGYTMSLPKNDRSYVSKKHMLDELVTLLGGRVSEAIILGDISTGASNDIERATSIARNMIVKYGMSDKLGPISYGSGNEEVFIGRDYGHMKNYSEETAAEIDKEIESIIMQAYERAAEILRLHIDKLHLLASYLIEYEKIDGPVFQELMTDPDFSSKLEKKKQEEKGQEEKETEKDQEEEQAEKDVSAEETAGEEKSGESKQPEESEQSEEPVHTENSEEPVAVKEPEEPEEPAKTVIAYGPLDEDDYANAELDDDFNLDTSDYMKYLSDEKPDDDFFAGIDLKNKTEAVPEEPVPKEPVPEVTVSEKETEEREEASEEPAKPEKTEEATETADTVEPETAETEESVTTDAKEPVVITAKGNNGTSKHLSLKNRFGKKNKPQIKVTPVAPVVIPEVPKIPMDFDIDPSLLRKDEAETEAEQESEQVTVQTAEPAEVEIDPSLLPGNEPEEAEQEEANAPVVPTEVEIDPSLLPGADEPQIETSPEPLFGSGFAELDEEKGSDSLSDENAPLVPGFLEDLDEKKEEAPEPAVENYVGDMVFYGQTMDEAVETVEETVEPEAVEEAEPETVEEFEKTEEVELVEETVEPETVEETEPETVGEPEETEEEEAVEETVEPETVEETEEVEPAEETVEPEAVKEVEPETVEEETVEETAEPETEETSKDAFGFFDGDDFAANNDAIYELYELLKSAREQDNDGENDPFKGGKK